ncbi:MAG: pteridine reductase [Gammaproteobacteria bacterium]|nr:pteridine reductase [Pseudomonadota bacterium]MCH9663716.1 pteridine reductase [Gammaproteobacteria bacterium]
MSSNCNSQCKLAVVTGGARRIGAVICSTLHQHGYDIVCTWRRSSAAAEALAVQLNQQRPNSATARALDLGNRADITALSQDIQANYGRLDILVNNASSYFPTPVSDIGDQEWTDLFDSNARGPLFLVQSLHSLLRQSQGSIVNLLDADIDRAIPGHTVYMMAKAALAAMTRSLALELAPAVRVNAVAPGSILWSNNEQKNPGHQQKEIERCFLGRTGTPEEVAEAVWWLAERATHTTGGIVHVDGGQHLHK